MDPTETVFLRVALPPKKMNPGLTPHPPPSSRGPSPAVALPALLWTDKLPYFFTFLIALAGWAITRAADRLTNSPLLEWSVRERADAEGLREVTYHLVNLSAAKPLRELNLFVRVEGPGQQSRFVDGWIIWRAPVMKPVDREFANGPYDDGRWAYYVIPELQPGCGVDLFAKVRGSGPLVLHLTDAVQAVRLQPLGLATWTVRHEMDLLLVLAGSTLGLLLGYVTLLSRQPAAPAGHPPPPTPPPLPP